MDPNLKNTRFLKALACEPVDKTPIWVMRQAGCYLPEYRATRAKAGSFMDLCQNPELACEVTMQPLARFDLDAAIIFSDILTIPDAMGLGLYFSEGEGPKFKNPVQTAKAIKQLAMPDPNESLGYVADAIRLVKKELDGKVPLIGFSGSPWTVATYMVEGGSSKQFHLIKKMLHAEPDLLHTLLDKLADSIILYLQSQIEAGVDVVMLFDTWGGVLSTEAYQIFSLAYMKKIMDALPSDMPCILFTKSGHQWLETIAQSGCQGIGLDWTIDIANARARVGDKIALQGNLDPSVLYAPPEVIVHEVNKIMTQANQQPGHIFNLGHGILPDIPSEHVQVLVDAVHEFKIL